MVTGRNFNEYIWCMTLFQICIRIIRLNSTEAESLYLYLEKGIVLIAKKGFIRVRLRYFMIIIID